MGVLLGYVGISIKNYIKLHASPLDLLIEYINLTCSRSSTQVSGQKPPTTHLIRRVWFQVWVAGGGSFTCVERMPILVYWVEFGLTSSHRIIHLLHCSQVDQNHFQQTAFIFIEVWVTRRGEFYGQVNALFCDWTFDIQNSPPSHSPLQTGGPKPLQTLKLAMFILFFGV
jgi:hypothetical protein